MPVTINEPVVNVNPAGNPNEGDASTRSSGSVRSSALDGDAARRARATDAVANEPRLIGVYPALVAGNVDPEHMGRVQVSFPWIPDDAGKGFTAWARLTQFAAGANRGAWFIPEVDDEVLVAFEAGDVNRPYVIGALWNGVDHPPVSEAEAGDNHIKRIKTRSGASITINDAPGQAGIAIELPNGGSVTVDQQDGVQISDETAQVQIKDGHVVVNAAKVQISASLVQFDSGTVTASGVIKCDSLITNSVVSASYTPGAGNVV